MQVNIDNLSKSYPAPSERLVILDGLHLQLDSGGSLAIQGPSGCGKSTLLHVLGLLDAPSVGEVHLDGKRIDNLPAHKRDLLRNGDFGFIFQFFNICAFRFWLGVSASLFSS